MCVHLHETEIDSSYHWYKIGCQTQTFLNLKFTSEVLGSPNEVRENDQVQGQDTA